MATSERRAILADPETLKVPDHLIRKGAAGTVAPIDAQGDVVDAQGRKLAAVAVIQEAAAVVVDQLDAELASVAKTGSYEDLDHKPDIAAQVSAAVNALLDGAPGALNTLNELATAIGDDANFAGTVVAALAQKLNSSALDAAAAALVSGGTGALAAALSATTVTQIQSEAQRRGSRYDIRDFGAKCDGAFATVTATAGSANITRSSGTWTSADIGKTIAVRGAGPVTTTTVGGTLALTAYGNDGVWLSTIASVSGNTATLATTATTTVSGAECVYGTPDDAAVSAAQDAAAVAGGEVYFPGQRHTVVTQTLTVKDNVRWMGAGMDVSHVWVLRDGTNWLKAPGTPILNGFVAMHFAIHCWAFFNSAGYTASVKPLNIFNQRRAIVAWMAIYDSPATALPFDHSTDYTVLAHNLVVGPGRLGAPGFGPGSSGIGLGTSGTGDINPTLVIGNTIIGNQTATVQGKGNNGIFLESQAGGDPSTDTVGYRIVDNIVIGMPIGIADDGSRGTIITGNTIIHCGQGISLNQGGVAGGHPGRDTLIAHNAIQDSWGPGTYDGTGILISTLRASLSARPNVNPTIRSLIRDNIITGGSKWGVLLEAFDVDLHGITIRGCSIRENGLTGIRLAKAPSNTTDKVRWVAITDNQVSNNGRSLVHGDDYGIFSNLKLYNHRIQNNDVYNDEIAVPTQAGTIYLAGSINQDGIVLNNATPNPDLLADTGLAAAAAMAGASLTAGRYTSKAWAIAGPGVWSYTGTGMKPSSGASTQILVDPTGLGINTDGSVHATIQALGSTTPLIGVVARATDMANYLRWSVHTTGKYRLQSTIGGVSTTLYDATTVTAAVGDVIKLAIDGPSKIRCYVNGVLIQEVTSTPTLTSLTGTKVGMIGGFTTDAVSALTGFGWTNNYRD